MDALARSSRLSTYLLGVGMSTMIERVARAIAAAEGMNDRYFSDNTMRVYAPLARAAIEAMREPDAAISEALERALSIWVSDLGTNEDVFIAVIDAALSGDA